VAEQSGEMLMAEQNQKDEALRRGFMVGMGVVLLLELQALAFVGLPATF